MKKLVNLSIMAMLFSVALVFVTSCSDDDKDEVNPDNLLTLNELPGAARLFVQNHFEESDVELILHSTSEGTEGYNVSVKGYKIDFDKNGSWEKIEAKDKGALPANIMALIPTSILGYVEQNYPSRGMNEIKKKDYGYKVKLAGTSDVELKFNFDGTIIKADEDGDNDDNNSDDEDIVTDALPAVSQSFIKEHFSSYTIKEVKKEDDSYEVEFTDKTQVEFYISGEWKKVEADNNIALPQSIIALLPEKAVTYISSVYPGKTIKEIENKKEVYEVELYKNIEIIFDKEGNLWGVLGNEEDENDNQSKITFESLPQPVKDFVNKHFSTIKILYVNKTYKEYKIGLTDGTRMDFTMDNQIQAIVAVRGGGIPPGAVLPSIAGYINKNYPNKKMTVYIKQYGGYFVELSGYPVSKVFFNLNGDFLRAYN